MALANGLTVPAEGFPSLQTIEIIQIHFFVQIYLGKALVNQQGAFGYQRAVSLATTTQTAKFILLHTFTKILTPKNVLFHQLHLIIAVAQILALLAKINIPKLQSALLLYLLGAPLALAVK